MARIFEGRAVYASATDKYQKWVIIRETNEGVAVEVEGFKAYLTPDEAATLANQLRALVRRCRKAQDQ